MWILSAFLLVSIIYLTHISTAPLETGDATAIPGKVVSHLNDESRKVLFSFGQFVDNYVKTPWVEDSTGDATETKGDENLKEDPSTDDKGTTPNTGKKKKGKRVGKKNPRKKIKNNNNNRKRRKNSKRKRKKHSKTHNAYQTVRLSEVLRSGQYQLLRQKRDQIQQQNIATLVPNLKQYKLENTGDTISTHNQQTNNKPGTGKGNDVKQLIEIVSIPTTKNEIKNLHLPYQITIPNIAEYSKDNSGINPQLDKIDNYIYMLNSEYVGEENHDSKQYNRIENYQKYNNVQKDEMKNMKQNECKDDGEIQQPISKYSENVSISKEKNEINKIQSLNQISKENKKNYKTNVFKDAQLMIYESHIKDNNKNSPELHKRVKRDNISNMQSDDEENNLKTQYNIISKNSKDNKQNGIKNPEKVKIELSKENNKNSMDNTINNSNLDNMANKSVGSISNYDKDKNEVTSELNNILDEWTLSDSNDSEENSNIEDKMIKSFKFPTKIMPFPQNDNNFNNLQLKNPKNSNSKNKSNSKKKDANEKMPNLVQNPPIRNKNTENHQGIPQTVVTTEPLNKQINELSPNNNDRIAGTPNYNQSIKDNISLLDDNNNNSESEELDNEIDASNFESTMSEDELTNISHIPPDESDVSDSMHDNGHNKINTNMINDITAQEKLTPFKPNYNIQKRKSKYPTTENDQNIKNQNEKNKIKNIPIPIQNDEIVNTNGQNNPIKPKNNQSKNDKNSRLDDNDKNSISDDVGSPFDIMNSKPETDMAGVSDFSNKESEGKTNDSDGPDNHSEFRENLINELTLPETLTPFIPNYNYQKSKTKEPTDKNSELPIVPNNAYDITSVPTPEENKELGGNNGKGNGILPEYNRSKNDKKDKFLDNDNNPNLDELGSQFDVIEPIPDTDKNTVKNGSNISPNERIPYETKNPDGIRQLMKNKIQNGVLPNKEIIDTTNNDKPNENILSPNMHFPIQNDEIVNTNGQSNPIKPKNNQSKNDKKSRLDDNDKNSISDDVGSPFDIMNSKPEKDMAGVSDFSNKESEGKTNDPDVLDNHSEFKENLINELTLPETLTPFIPNYNYQKSKTKEPTDKNSELPINPNNAYDITSVPTPEENIELGGNNGKGNGILPEYNRSKNDKKDKFLDNDNNPNLDELGSQFDEIEPIPDTDKNTVKNGSNISPNERTPYETKNPDGIRQLMKNKIQNGVLPNKEIIDNTNNDKPIENILSPNMHFPIQNDEIVNTNGQSNPKTPKNNESKNDKNSRLDDNDKNSISDDVGSPFDIMNSKPETDMAGVSDFSNKESKGKTNDSDVPDNRSEFKENLINELTLPETLTPFIPKYNYQKSKTKEPTDKNSELPIVTNNAYDITSVPTLEENKELGGNNGKGNGILPEYNRSKNDKKDKFLDNDNNPNLDELGSQFDVIEPIPDTDKNTVKNGSNISPNERIPYETKNPDGIRQLMKNKIQNGVLPNKEIIDTTNNDKPNENILSPNMHFPIQNDEIVNTNGQSNPIKPKNNQSKNDKKSRLDDNDKNSISDDVGSPFDIMNSKPEKDMAGVSDFSNKESEGKTNDPDVLDNHSEFKENLINELTLPETLTPFIPNYNYQKSKTKEPTDKNSELPIVPNNAYDITSVPTLEENKELGGNNGKGNGILPEYNRSKNDKKDKFLDNDNNPNLDELGSQFDEIEPIPDTDKNTVKNGSDISPNERTPYETKNPDGIRQLMENKIQNSVIPNKEIIDSTNNDKPIENTPSPKMHFPIQNDEIVNTNGQSNPKTTKNNQSKNDKNSRLDDNDNNSISDDVGSPFDIMNSKPEKDMAGVSDFSNKESEGKTNDPDVLDNHSEFKENLINELTLPETLTPFIPNYNYQKSKTKEPTDKNSELPIVPNNAYDITSVPTPEENIELGGNNGKGNGILPEYNRSKNDKKDKFLDNDNNPNLDELGSQFDEIEPIPDTDKNTVKNGSNISPNERTPYETKNPDGIRQLMKNKIQNSVIPNKEIIDSTNNDKAIENTLSPKIHFPIQNDEIVNTNGQSNPKTPKNNQSKNDKNSRLDDNDKNSISDDVGSPFDIMNSKPETDMAGVSDFSNKESKGKTNDSDVPDNRSEFKENLINELTLPETLTPFIPKYNYQKSKTKEPTDKNSELPIVTNNAYDITSVPTLEENKELGGNNGKGNGILPEYNRSKNDKKDKFLDNDNNPNLDELGSQFDVIEPIPDTDKNTVKNGSNISPNERTPYETKNPDGIRQLMENKIQNNVIPNKEIIDSTNNDKPIENTPSPKMHFPIQNDEIVNTNGQSNPKTTKNNQSKNDKNSRLDDNDNNSISDDVGSPFDIMNSKPEKDMAGVSDFSNKESEGKTNDPDVLDNHSEFKENLINELTLPETLTPFIPNYNYQKSKTKEPTDKNSELPIVPNNAYDITSVPTPEENIELGGNNGKGNGILPEYNRSKNDKKDKFLDNDNNPNLDELGSQFDEIEPIPDTDKNTVKNGSNISPNERTPYETKNPDGIRQLMKNKIQNSVIPNKEIIDSTNNDKAIENTLSPKIHFPIQNDEIVNTNGQSNPKTPKNNQSKNDKNSRLDDNDKNSISDDVGSPFDIMNSKPETDMAGVSDFSNKESKGKTNDSDVPDNRSEFKENLINELTLPETLTPFIPKYNYQKSKTKEPTDKNSELPIVTNNAYDITSVPTLEENKELGGNNGKGNGILPEYNRSKNDKKDKFLDNDNNPNLDELGSQFDVIEPIPDTDKNTVKNGSNISPNERTPYETKNPDGIRQLMENKIQNNVIPNKEIIDSTNNDKPIENTPSPKMHFPIQNDEIVNTNGQSNPKTTKNNQSKNDKNSRLDDNDNNSISDDVGSPFDIMNSKPEKDMAGVSDFSNKESEGKTNDPDVLDNHSEFKENLINELTLPETLTPFIPNYNYQKSKTKEPTDKNSELPIVPNNAYDITSVPTPEENIELGGNNGKGNGILPEYNRSKNDKKDKFLDNDNNPNLDELGSQFDEIEPIPDTDKNTVKNGSNISPNERTPYETKNPDGIRQLMKNKIQNSVIPNKEIIDTTNNDKPNENILSPNMHFPIQNDEIVNTNGQSNPIKPKNNQSKNDKNSRLDDNDKNSISDDVGSPFDIMNSKPKKDMAGVSDFSNKESEGKMNDLEVPDNHNEFKENLINELTLQDKLTPKQSRIDDNESNSNWDDVRSPFRKDNNNKSQLIADNINEILPIIPSNSKGDKHISKIDRSIPKPDSEKDALTDILNLSSMDWNTSDSHKLDGNDLFIENEPKNGFDPVNPTFHNSKDDNLPIKKPPSTSQPSSLVDMEPSVNKGDSNLRLPKENQPKIDHGILLDDFDNNSISDQLRNWKSPQSKLLDNDNVNKNPKRFDFDDNLFSSSIEPLLKDFSDNNISDLFDTDDNRRKDKFGNDKGSSNTVSKESNLPPSKSIIPGNISPNISAEPIMQDDKDNNNKNQLIADNINEILPIIPNYPNGDKHISKIDRSIPKPDSEKDGLKDILNLSSMDWNTSDSHELDGNDLFKENEPKNGFDPVNPTFHNSMDDNFPIKKPPSTSLPSSLVDMEPSVNKGDSNLRIPKENQPKIDHGILLGDFDNNSISDQLRNSKSPQSKLLDNDNVNKNPKRFDFDDNLFSSSIEPLLKDFSDNNISDLFDTDDNRRKDKFGNDKGSSNTVSKESNLPLSKSIIPGNISPKISAEPIIQDDKDNNNKNQLIADNINEILPIIPNYPNGDKHISKIDRSIPKPDSEKDGLKDILNLSSMDWNTSDSHELDGNDLFKENEPKNGFDPVNPTFHNSMDDNFPIKKPPSTSLPSSLVDMEPSVNKGDSNLRIPKENQPKIDHGILLGDFDNNSISDQLRNSKSPQSKLLDNDNVNKNPKRFDFDDNLFSSSIEPLLKDFSDNNISDLFDTDDNRRKDKFGNDKGSSNTVSKESNLPLSKSIIPGNISPKISAEPIIQDDKDNNNKNQLIADNINEILPIIPCYPNGDKHISKIDRSIPKPDSEKDGLTDILNLSSMDWNTSDSHELDGNDLFKENEPKNGFDPVNPTFHNSKDDNLPIKKPPSTSQPSSLVDMEPSVNKGESNLQIPKENQPKIDHGILLDDFDNNSISDQLRNSKSPQSKLLDNDNVNKNPKRFDFDDNLFSSSIEPLLKDFSDNNISGLFDTDVNRRKDKFGNDKGSSNTVSKESNLPPSKSIIPGNISPNISAEPIMQDDKDNNNKNQLIADNINEILPIIPNYPNGDKHISKIDRSIPKPDSEKDGLKDILNLSSMDWNTSDSHELDGNDLFKENEPKNGFDPVNPTFHNSMDDNLPIKKPPSTSLPSSLVDMEPSVNKGDSNLRIPKENQPKIDHGILLGDFDNNSISDQLRNSKSPQSKLLDNDNVNKNPKRFDFDDNLFSSSIEPLLKDFSDNNISDLFDTDDNRRKDKFGNDKGSSNTVSKESNLPLSKSIIPGNISPKISAEPIIQDDKDNNNKNQLIADNINEILPIIPCYPNGDKHISKIDRSIPKPDSEKDGLTDILNLSSMDWNTSDSHELDGNDLFKENEPKNGFDPVNPTFHNSKDDNLPIKKPPSTSQPSSLVDMEPSVNKGESNLQIPKENQPKIDHGILLDDFDNNSISDQLRNSKSPQSKLLDNDNVNKNPKRFDFDDNLFSSSIEPLLKDFSDNNISGLFDTDVNRRKDKFGNDKGSSNTVSKESNLPPSKSIIPGNISPNISAEPIMQDDKDNNNKNQLIADNINEILPIIPNYPNGDKHISKIDRSIPKPDSEKDGLKDILNLSSMDWNTSDSHELDGNDLFKENEPKNGFDPVNPTFHNSMDDNLPIKKPPSTSLPSSLVDMEPSVNKGDSNLRIPKENQPKIDHGILLGDFDNNSISDQLRNSKSPQSKLLDNDNVNKNPKRFDFDDNLFSSSIEPLLKDFSDNNISDLFDTDDNRRKDKFGNDKGSSNTVSKESNLPLSKSIIPGNISPKISAEPIIQDDKDNNNKNQLIADNINEILPIIPCYPNGDKHISKIDRSIPKPDSEKDGLTDILNLSSMDWNTSDSHELDGNDLFKENEPKNGFDPVNPTFHNSKDDNLPIKKPPSTSQPSSLVDMEPSVNKGESNLQIPKENQPKIDHGILLDDFDNNSISDQLRNSKSPQSKLLDNDNVNKNPKRFDFDDNLFSSSIEPLLKDFSDNNISDLFDTDDNRRKDKFGNDKGSSNTVSKESNLPPSKSIIPGNISPKISAEPIMQDDKDNNNKNQLIADNINEILPIIPSYPNGDKHISKIDRSIPKPDSVKDGLKDILNLSSMDWNTSDSHELDGNDLFKENEPKNGFDPVNPTFQNSMDDNLPIKKPPSTSLPSSLVDMEPSVNKGDSNLRIPKENQPKIDHGILLDDFDNNSISDQLRNSKSPQSKLLDNGNVDKNPKRFDFDDNLFSSSIEPLLDDFSDNNISDLFDTDDNRRKDKFGNDRGSSNTVSKESNLPLSKSIIPGNISPKISAEPRMQDDKDNNNKNQLIADNINEILPIIPNYPNGDKHISKIDRSIPKADSEKDGLTDILNLSSMDWNTSDSHELDGNDLFKENEPKNGFDPVNPTFQNSMDDNLPIKKPPSTSLPSSLVDMEPSVNMGDSNLRIPKETQPKIDHGILLDDFDNNSISDQLRNSKSPQSKLLDNGNVDKNPKRFDFDDNFFSSSIEPLLNDFSDNNISDLFDTDDNRRKDKFGNDRGSSNTVSKESNLPLSKSIIPGNISPKISAEPIMQDDKDNNNKSQLIVDNINKILPIIPNYPNGDKHISKIDRSIPKPDSEKDGLKDILNLSSMDWNTSDSHELDGNDLFKENEPKNGFDPVNPTFHNSMDDNLPIKKPPSTSLPSSLVDMEPSVNKDDSNLRIPKENQPKIDHGILLGDFDNNSISDQLRNSKSPQSKLLDNDNVDKNPKRFDFDDNLFSISIEPLLNDFSDNNINDLFDTDDNRRKDKFGNDRGSSNTVSKESNLPLSKSIIPGNISPKISAEPIMQDDKDNNNKSQLIVDNINKILPIIPNNSNEDIHVSKIDGADDNWETKQNILSDGLSKLTNDLPNIRNNPNKKLSEEDINTQHQFILPTSENSGDIKNKNNMLNGEYDINQNGLKIPIQKFEKHKNDLEFISNEGISIPNSLENMMAHDDISDLLDMNSKQTKPCSSKGLPNFSKGNYNNNLDIKDMDSRKTLYQTITPETKSSQMELGPPTSDVIASDDLSGILIDNINNIPVVPKTSNKDNSTKNQVADIALRIRDKNKGSGHKPFSNPKKESSEQLIEKAIPEPIISTIDHKIVPMYKSKTDLFPEILPQKTNMLNLDLKKMVDTSDILTPNDMETSTVKNTSKCIDDIPVTSSKPIKKHSKEIINTEPLTKLPISKNNLPALNYIKEVPNEINYKNTKESINLLPKSKEYANNKDQNKKLLDTGYDLFSSPPASCSDVEDLFNMNDAPNNYEPTGNSVVNDHTYISKLPKKVFKQDNYEIIENTDVQKINNPKFHDFSDDLKSNEYGKKTKPVESKYISELNDDTMIKANVGQKVNPTTLLNNNDYDSNGYKQMHIKNKIINNQNNVYPLTSTMNSPDITLPKTHSYIANNDDNSYGYMIPKFSTTYYDDGYSIKNLWESIPPKYNQNSDGNEGYYHFKSITEDNKPASENDKGNTIPNYVNNDKELNTKDENVKCNRCHLNTNNNNAIFDSLFKQMADKVLHRIDDIDSKISNLEIISNNGPHNKENNDVTIDDVKVSTLNSPSNIQPIIKPKNLNDIADTNSIQNNNIDRIEKLHDNENIEENEIIKPKKLNMSKSKLNNTAKIIEKLHSNESDEGEEINKPKNTDKSKYKEISKIVNTFEKIDNSKSDEENKIKNPSKTNKSKHKKRNRKKTVDDTEQDDSNESDKDNVIKNPKMMHKLNHKKRNKTEDDVENIYISESDEDDEDDVIKKPKNRKKSKYIKHIKDKPKKYLKHKMHIENDISGYDDEDLLRKNNNTIMKKKKNGKKTIYIHEDSNEVDSNSSVEPSNEIYEYVKNYKTEDKPKKKKKKPKKKKKKHIKHLKHSKKKRHVGKPISHDLDESYIEYDQIKVPKMKKKHKKKKNRRRKKLDIDIIEDNDTQVLNKGSDTKKKNGFEYITFIPEYAYSYGNPISKLFY